MFQIKSSSAFSSSILLISLILNGSPWAKILLNDCLNVSEAGGGIVVDDLTDAQLARVVEDMQRSVKRLSLETKMFEGKVDLNDDLECCKMQSQLSFISNEALSAIILQQT